MPKTWTKFPTGTWVRAAEIYSQKYSEYEKKKETAITPNLIRSRFYNTFNVYVVKAVEEATQQLREEYDELLVRKNDLLTKYARN